MTALVLAAVAVVVALAAYAGWLHFRLWQQRRGRQAQAPVVQAFSPGQRPDLHKTLYVLADALLNDKMTHTEGCLRICAMASHLEDSDGFRREYGVLFRVAEATAHFPILDDWQALDSGERRRLTQQRLAIEGRYREAVIEAATRVREAMGQRH